MEGGDGGGRDRIDVKKVLSRRISPFVRRFRVSLECRPNIFPAQRKNTDASGERKASTIFGKESFRSGCVNEEFNCAIFSPLYRAHRRNRRHRPYRLRNILIIRHCIDIHFTRVAQSSVGSYKKPNEKEILQVSLRSAGRKKHESVRERQRKGLMANESKTRERKSERPPGHGSWNAFARLKCHRSASRCL